MPNESHIKNPEEYPRIMRAIYLLRCGDYRKQQDIADECNIKLDTLKNNWRVFRLKNPNWRNEKPEEIPAEIHEEINEEISKPKKPKMKPYISKNKQRKQNNKEGNMLSFKDLLPMPKKHDRHK